MIVLCMPDMEDLLTHACIDLLCLCGNSCDLAHNFLGGFPLHGDHHLVSAAEVDPDCWERVPILE